MQLYAAEYQPGVPLAASLRSANSSGTFKATARQLSDVVMVAASAFAVQDYPDARWVLTHKQVVVAAASND